MAKVSVVIPCYNGADFIAETVDSVLNQSLSDLELILVDDGSTDNTLGIMQSFDDQRIKLVSQSNAGVSVARNSGYKQSIGQFVTFLDADDVFERESLEKRVYFLENHPDFGAVNTAFITFDSDSGKTLGLTPSQPINLLNRTLCYDGPTGMLPSTVMMRSDVFEQVGGWDENLSTSADRDMWVRLAAITQVGGIDEPLTKYRAHANQMHHNIVRMKKDADYLFEKAYSNNLFPSTSFYHYCMARKSWILGASFIKDAKDYGSGFKELFNSLRYHPGYVWDQLLGRPLRIPNGEQTLNLEQPK